MNKWTTAALAVATLLATGTPIAAHADDPTLPPAIAAACNRPGTRVVLTSADVDKGLAIRRGRCDLSGTSLSDGLAAAATPPAGQFVIASVEGRSEARSSQLLVSSDSNGDLTVGRPQPAQMSQLATASTMCGGTDFSWSGRKWKTSPTFYVNEATYPHSITASEFVTDANTAASTWVSGKNQCGQTLKSNLQTTLSYAGNTTRTASVSNNTCTGTDAYSVISGGYPDSTKNTLASTCAYGSSVTTSIFEGDIMVNGVDFQWTNTLSGCTSRFDLPTVLTHEFGHFMGFNHVPDDTNPGSVMGPTQPPCDILRTMSLGDYRGWDYAYFQTF